MTDREVIAWARMLGDTWHQLFGEHSKAAYRFRRLADLAEKATEPCDKCGSEEPTERHLCAICAITERPDRHEAPPEPTERAAEDWQPIASAPANYDTVELVVRGFHNGVDWVEAGTNRVIRPTHWCPLPAPPGGER